MECLNLRFVRIGSKNTVRTARNKHQAITAEWFVYIYGTEVDRPDWKQCIDKQLPIYWWACVDRRMTIVQYGTSSFQQNFGVFTNFNSVFYNLLPSYFMPGFHELFATLYEQICGVHYCEKIK